MGKHGFVIKPIAVGDKSCCWCEVNNKNAVYQCYAVVWDWMDYACEKHYQEYFNKRSVIINA